MNTDFQEFYSIYQSFMREKGLSRRYHVPSTDVDFIKKYGTLFTARLGGNVIGGHLYLEDESHMDGWLFASRRLEVKQKDASSIGRANCFAMKYAKQKGIKEFSFGSIGSSPCSARDPKRDPIAFFKLGFVSVPRMKYHYSKSYSLPYKFAKGLRLGE